jgi:hypothetical protein
MTGFCQACSHAGITMDGMLFLFKTQLFVQIPTELIVIISILIKDFMLVLLLHDFYVYGDMLYEDKSSC